MRAAAASTPSRQWLHNAALDLLVGCGAWSLPLLVLTFLVQRENAVSVAFAFYLLGVFCNNPHYMATLHRAYHTAEDFNKYRFFTVYVTVLLLLTVVLVHLIPGLFPWVVTLYLTWSPWHYTGQNFGIAQMFARRAGAPSDPLARQLLYASYAASYGVWFLTLHTARDAGDPYFISLGIPETVAVPLQFFFILVFLGCATGAFTHLARHLPVQALIGPLTLTLTQLLWFVAPTLLTRFAGLALPASYFSAGALAFMHCAQYLWITSYYARQETGRAALTGAASAPRRFNFWSYYFALIVGGIALFIPGPWLTSRLLKHDFVESFMIFMALVNLHHFILDGAIWKLRDGRIARLLLGSNREKNQETEVGQESGGHHLGWLFGPARTARILRYVLGGALLALAAIDQWQYFATTRAADGTALARAATINPYDSRPAFRSAQKLAAAGDGAGAQRELRQILALNPFNAPAQHLLGELIFRSGDTAAALAHYDRMAELFRPDLAIATNRGLLATERGRPADAVARFEEALRLAPHQARLHFLLAEALGAAGQPHRAIAQYELFTVLLKETSAISGDDLALYREATFRLGDFYDRQGDSSHAEPWFQRAADLAATQHQFAEAKRALTRLAELQEKLGRADDAAKNRALALQAGHYSP